MTGETIYIDLNTVPPGFLTEVAKMGLKWEGWEPQPQADQIKMTGCTNVPKELPKWLRIA